MEQKGKIISCSGDISKVLVVRSTACNSCHRKDSCNEAMFLGCADSKVEIEANNLCNAQIGDSVELYSSSAKSLFYAFLCFVLPIILAFLAYFVAFSLNIGEIQRYTSAIVAFFVSFFVLFFFSNRKMSGKISVNIVKVLESNGREEKP